MPRARLWYRLPYEGRDGWRAAATQQLGARGWQPASLERAPAPGLDVLAFDVPSLAGLDDLRRELTADRDWREAATRAALAIDDRQAWGLGPLRTQVVAEEAVIVGGTRSGNWMNIDAHDGLPSVLINDIDSLPDGRLCLATYEGLCLFDGTTARRHDGAHAARPGRCLPLGPAHRRAQRRYGLDRPRRRVAAASAR